MFTSAMLRWSLMCLGCWAIVLLGATPTDRSPPQASSAKTSPTAAGPLADPAPEEPPASGARQSVVRLSEAEVAEALKIMKQLGDNPLAGTLMDQPLAAGSSTARVDGSAEQTPGKTPSQPVELLREIAGRVDAMANQLEAEDLYAAADQLRKAADRLRRNARRIRQSE